MSEAHCVFEFGPSLEESRPQIDYKASSLTHNCASLEEIMEGKRDPRDAELVKYVSARDDAPEWDCFDSGGLSPLFSRRSVETLGRSLFYGFTFINATVNGAPYYLLRSESRIDCLDRGRSTFVTFPHDPTRIMRFKKYAFHLDRLLDPMIFRITDRRGGLFATESIEQMVAERGLRGFRFVLLDGTPQATLDSDSKQLARTYENHYFGLRIEIPEPWDLVSWKHAAISRTSQEQFQMRDDELPAVEKVGKFLFTLSRYSRLSRATIDGSIELCVFRFPPGTSFASMAQYGSAPDRKGVWTAGGIEWSYYDHDLRRPEGGTIRHLYYHVSDDVWLYAKIAGYEDRFFHEAVEVFEGLSRLPAEGKRGKEGKGRLN